MKVSKKRLDQILVISGYAESRAKAQALIMSGVVKVDGKIMDKCGVFVKEDAKIEIKEGLKYVSRGGDKLAGALKDFNFSVDGMVVLDIGSSTGGFTDCLLQNKAKKVYALDVGYGQLDQKLRQDKRVNVIEKFNAKNLNKEIIAERIDLITIDVSFISLKKILPVFDKLDFSGYVIGLIKPQFEAGVKYVKKGVVKDQQVILSVIRDIECFAEKLNYEVLNVKQSVLKGPKGNTEYFILLKKKISG